MPPGVPSKKKRTRLIGTAFRPVQLQLAVLLHMMLEGKRFYLAARFWRNLNIFAAGLEALQLLG